MPKRIVICITGSTGAIYGYRMLLATSRIRDLETHLVISEAGEQVMKMETGVDRSTVEGLATHAHNERDFKAGIASGSFLTSGMVIAPCSMKTLAAIASGLEENLVARAAMVTLKERRPLILLARETPLSLIHLRNMVQITEAGGTIMPPLPPMYFGVNDITELVDLTVGRVLNMLGVRTDLLKEWSVD